MREPNREWKIPEDHTGKQGPNGTEPKYYDYTVLTPGKILAYEDDPADVILECGYLERGAPCVFCGPPGIGKSRLSLQLAICAILGKPFIGWEVNADGLIWLILQNENGMRRLKCDLLAMCSKLSSGEMDKLEKQLYIHCLISDIDGILSLDIPEARRGIVKMMEKVQPNVVVNDPLTSFGNNKLDQDFDMLQTCKDLGRLVMERDPKNLPVVLHHARTGKAANAQATGFDRSSFARNSKALYGWTRAQVNIVPYEAKSNASLVICSGKCNNFAEFEPFGITLDKPTLTYHRDDNLDVSEWMDEMTGGTPAGRPRRYTRGDILETMGTVVPLSQMDCFREYEKKVSKEKAMVLRTFKELWKELVELKEIKEWPEKSGKWVKA